MDAGPGETVSVSSHPQESGTGRLAIQALLSEAYP